MNYTIEEMKTYNGLYFGEFLLKENELVYVYGTRKNFIIIPLRKIERYLNLDDGIEAIKNFMEERYMGTLQSSRYLPNPFEDLVKYHYNYLGRVFQCSEPGLDNTSPIMDCAFQWISYLEN